MRAKKILVGSKRKRTTPLGKLCCVPHGWSNSTVSGINDDSIDFGFPSQLFFFPRLRPFAFQKRLKPTRLDGQKRRSQIGDGLEWKEPEQGPIFCITSKKLWSRSCWRRIPIVKNPDFFFQPTFFFPIKIYFKMFCFINIFFFSRIRKKDCKPLS